MQRVIILVLILVSLVPIFYINRKLQAIIAPRKSFARLIVYMLTCFALVFFYTFLISLIVFKLFHFK